MHLSESLTKLEQLILDTTKGEVTGKLRGRVIALIEHAEALETDYAALKNAHTVLKNQTGQLKIDFAQEKTALEAKIAELEQRNAEGAKRPADLDKEQIRILQLFFVKDASMSSKYIARVRRMKIGVVKYHCDRLFERGFLGIGSTEELDGPMPLVLSDKGRAYLVENDLV